MMKAEKRALIVPGIYDMPMADYLRDPCPQPSLSSSAANAIIGRSPRHAWHEHPRLNPETTHDNSTALDIGTAAHSLFLEGDESRLIVIEADDYRTKAAREFRDEAHANGMTPLLAKHARRVRAIVAASKVAIDSCSELSGTFGILRERSLLWTEGKINPLWCRARPDVISDDHAIVLNYKTTATNAEPESFGNGYLIRGGYHVQAYHHLRGVEVLTGVQAKFVWMVQEIEPPYCCSFIGMSPSLRGLAEAQWSHAMSVWHDCIHSGEWPGYPNRIAWIEAPVWYAQRWCERPDVLDDASGVLSAMGKIGGFVK